MSNHKNLDDMMTKYSVQEDRPTGKTSAADAVCPECGRRLKSYGEVLWCPMHGSEPFERK